VLSKLFNNNTSSTSKSHANVSEYASGWRHIVVPAFGAPFSLRSIRVTAKIAAHCPDCEVHLLYLVEVPRSFALNAPMPEEEALAQTVLADGLKEARRWMLQASTETLHVREPIEGLAKYVERAQVDLLVLGVRPDETRGLNRRLARKINERRPCQVIIDYIAGE
jgi:nucleotide-binding universal stress UspA family protein